MVQFKNIVLVIIISIISMIAKDADAQQIDSNSIRLTPSEVSIISISALTAKGDLEKLELAIEHGLASGLTVNEIKEILIHTYAYCGFPRSIRGLQTFMGVMEERKKRGIQDNLGRFASEIDQTESKYKRGKAILDGLTGTVSADTLSGYSAFAPTIDVFLKEHLFADIFERDVLNYVQRELVTVSVIAAIERAEPMLRSHLTICLNIGLSEKQLQQYVDTLRSTLGEPEARSAQSVLNEVIENYKSK
ncbi:carboxymuconolactone decarboxylase family protein [Sphingobacterium hotanense]|uniref:carboxymuconolactone decarboxylase family protein n=1 Tax=Sphingobacterium hotanense TaxID=649196 RepID=UPI0021A80FE0|nr:carboxymuconolactone decarboxylase family protein [Sphingobacterium hotanense]MCT1524915.1 carboxymuconolactone decarboxylase family protein [Sphingobacterium hotanense]